MAGSDIISFVSSIIKFRSSNRTYAPMPCTYTCTYMYMLSRLVYCQLNQLTPVLIPWFGC